MAVVGAGNEREGALAFVGVKWLTDCDDGFGMVADVIERPLVKVDVFLCYD